MGLNIYNPKKAHPCVITSYELSRVKIYPRV